MTYTLQLHDWVAVRPAHGFGYNQEAEVKEITGNKPNRQFKVLYNNGTSEIITAKRVAAVTRRSRRGVK